MKHMIRVIIMIILLNGLAVAESKQHADNEISKRILLQYPFPLPDMHARNICQGIGLHR